MSDIGQRIIREVIAVAQERPDFVYARPAVPSPSFGQALCQYVQDGQPGCIIGQALWRLGYIGPSLEEAGENTSAVGSVLSYLNLHLDDEEADWLRDVQYQQDSGQRWFRAVELAGPPPVI